MSYKTLFYFIWQFIKPSKLSFLLILLVSLVWSFDSTIWPYILRVLIDIFTQFDQSRHEAWNALKYPLLGGLFFWLCVELGFRCQGFLLAKSVPKMEAKIRVHMFDHIQRHSPKYFNEHFAGSLSTKITDMVTQVSLILQQALTLFIPAIVSCLISIFFFANINPFFGSLFAVWILCHLSICLLFTKKIDHYEGIHNEIRSKLVGKIVDSFTNNFAVNLFYRFEHEKNILIKNQQEETAKHYQAKKYVEKMRVFLGLFTFLGPGLTINGLMVYFWLNDKISTGEVAQLFNTTWNIVMMLWLAGSAIPGLFQSMGVAKQALKLLQDPQDILDPKDARSLIVNEGKISFENVTFQYGNKPLFQNQYLHIEGGQKVGLVGFSGAGKSTFVNLILKFFAIQEGKITIDHQDISHIKLESLRKQVAMIPQEPILFHRTLRENIAYGNPEATEAQIFEAAKMAHCDEFIKKMPLGYETLIGERGTKLSGGEKQRIAIARALLRNSPILILDEATSALDSITEQLIQDSLEMLMKGKTTLVIAHRLSTLSKMDRILVFKQGQIVEDGTHEQLLEINGHYARMWEKQAGGFLPELAIHS